MSGMNVVTIDDDVTEVVVNDDQITVNVSEQVVKVEIGTSGPQGPVWIPDPDALSYVHNQSTPSATWNITHPLSFIPSVIVVDSAGNVVEGSYQYTGANTLVLTFSGAFSGKAYLS